MEKEKDKKKAMKLSNYDRTMATIRLPEYQQEYAEYARVLEIDKKKAERLGNRMAKKWSQYSSPGEEWLLPIRPVPPYVNIELLKFTHYYNKPVHVFDIKNADRLAEIYPQAKLKEETANLVTKMLIDVHQNLFKNKNRKETTKEAFNLEDAISQLRPTYSYEGGKFLFLMIDLEKNEETITKELKSIITTYKKNMPINKSRQRVPLIDPWKVYDMHHGIKLKAMGIEIDGMNFQQIAKQLSGINKTGKDGNPSYNNRLLAWYKTVERAYEKANRIIEQVRKEAEQPA